MARSRWPAIFLATLMAASVFNTAQSASAAPVRYESENAVISQGVVESNHTGFTGTGFVNGDNAVGAYVEYTVTAAQAGTHSLAFRYANGTTANRPLDITVNGTLVANDLAFPATGAWTTWNTITTNVALVAGSNKIRTTSVVATGGPNADSLTVDSAGPPDTQAPTTPGTPSVSGTLGCTSATLTWTASSDNVGVAGYRISNAGAVLATATAPPATVNGLSSSTNYSFTIVAFDAAGNISASSGAVAVRTPACGSGTPVAINGQLHVCGTKLCNQFNKPIQLRGMSTHGIQWYASCVKTASLDALATDWNADVLRIAMYIQEGGYETNPRRFTDLVHGYIEEATRRGMYALVDWHQLSPGDPNANTARAKTFFTEIAQRHKDKVNIIYDIANEPNGVSWSRVKSYAEEMIPVIRAQDSNGVVFVGTHGWSTFGISDGGSETEVFNNPINATNFMYTFHFYAASHRDNYLNALSRIADRVPVFVTEFGTQTSSGDGGNDFTMSQRYIDLLASKQIGWTNWNFSDDSRSGAVFKSGTCAGSSFTGTGVLKPAGIWVRDRIRTPDTFPTG